MSDVGRPADRLVRIAVPADRAVAVAEDERDLVLAEEPPEPVGLSIEPQEPRAVAIQQNRSQGLAYQGVPLFNVVAGLQGRQGKQGIPGPSGGSVIQRVAGEAISALRVLYELDDQVYVLDAQDAEHADLAVGISITAAAAGQDIQIQRDGALDDGSWSWAPGLVFNGADGIPTQVVPADGVELILGSSTGPQRINLNFFQPLYL